MKPKQLILSAWGPYKDRVEIDFTKLRERGIFLITGPTGAGKTTVFDAITYALYGNMSGEMRDKSSVRSDFALSGEETFVELVMEHREAEYRIVRNPEYMRLKKRQTDEQAFTKEKENAVLTMPDGKCVEGVGAVNRRLQEILVLDYRQFKQISMIAQGEFARLLVAPPAEKTKIFREIFATSMYDRFAVHLKNRANELYRQVMEYRHRIDEDVHMLRSGKEETGKAEMEEMPSVPLLEAGMEIPLMLLKLKGYIRLCKGRLTEEKRRYELTEHESEQLTEQIVRANKGNDSLRALKEAIEQEDICREEEPIIKQLAIELNAARSAAALQGDYDKWVREEQLLSDQKAKKKALIREEESLTKGCGELAALHEDRLAQAEVYECKKKLEETEKQLADAVAGERAASIELERQKSSYLEIEKKALEKKEEYDKADLLYKRAAVGIAARLLREGEPCPVCGSKEHPKPAVVTEEIPDEEGLRKLKEQFEEWDRQRMEIHGSAAASRGEHREKKKKAEELIDKVNEEQKQWELLPARLRETVSALTRTQWEEMLAKYDRLSVMLGEKKEAVRMAVLEEQAFRVRAAEVYTQLEDKVQMSGLATIEELLENRRDEVFLENATERIISFESRLHSAGSLTTHLKKETKDIVYTDVTVLEANLKVLQEKKKAILKRQTEVSHRRQEGIKVCKSMKERYEKLRGLEAEYGIVRDLDNLASGNNQKRLVFEQYVLAGYFEEILRAANIRLAKMTEGRFELFRAAEVSDGRTKDNLEMNVLDNYTGKYRSVKTLSGGESFKASLSLALGMSDVIQAYSGGIRVEALFIDEGFGSLDMESLDQACETLLSLVERDRLIGIISHVPELKEKIQNRIEIKKTNVGSSLRVMVY